MSIKDISEYYYDGKSFVIRSSKTKAVRQFVASAFLVIATLYATNPMISGQSIRSTIHSVAFDQSEYQAVAYITKVNSKVSEDDAKKIYHSSIKWGTKFGVEPSLLLAIAKVESTYDKHAISPVGAFGVLQVLPKWHVDKIKEAKKETGSPELFEIDSNVYVGAKIIKECIKKYNGNVNTALRCYNGSVNIPTTYDLDVIKAKKEIQTFI